MTPEQRAAEILERWSRPRGNGKELGISHIALEEWHALVMSYTAALSGQEREIERLKSLMEEDSVKTDTLRAQRDALVKALTQCYALAADRSGWESRGRLASRLLDIQEITGDALAAEKGEKPR